MNQNKKLTILCLGIVLVLTMIALTGCKKKAETTVPVPAEIKNVTSEAAEQKICPIMAGPINKDIYTEYKGKKVYFCCAGCETKFKENPEKYLAKLPQFDK